jgi:cell division protein ZapA
MAELAIAINGRTYNVRCDDGEEARVARLAADVDRRARHLAESLGQVDEARLLAMTSLLLADELDEAHRRAEADPADAGPAEHRHRPATLASTARLAAEVDALAERIETVAARLGGA